MSSIELVKVQPLSERNAISAAEGFREFDRRLAGMAKQMTILQQQVAMLTQRVAQLEAQKISVIPTGHGPTQ
jgi:hypothetical protein